MNNRELLQKENIMKEMKISLAKVSDTVIGKTLERNPEGGQPEAPKGFRHELEQQAGQCELQCEIRSKPNAELLVKITISNDQEQPKLSKNGS